MSSATWGDININFSSFMQNLTLLEIIVIVSLRLMLLKGVYGTFTVLFHWQLSFSYRHLVEVDEPRCAWCRSTNYTETTLNLVPHEELTSRSYMYVHGLWLFFNFVEAYYHKINKADYRLKCKFSSNIYKILYSHHYWDFVG